MALSELWMNLGPIAPELVLALTICVMLVLDMFSSPAGSRRVAPIVALLGTVWALLLVAVSYGGLPEPALNFRGMLVHDAPARFFRLFFLLGTGLCILFSMRSREASGYRQGEFYGLLLGATLGAMFLASADNFVMLLLALETLSMASYVLAGFLKHQRRSAEAGLKYMLYGAVASGAMLFGLSYLYGMTGTLSISGAMGTLPRAVAEGVPGMAVALAMVLVLTGLGFKMALVPFHFWCPDVYQGAPTPITAFLSVISKGAGFVALLRLCLPFFGGPGAPMSLEEIMRLAFLESTHLPLLFGLLAVVTMTLGNFVALRQTDVKRLLAYSSIAHAGYLLMAMAVPTPEAAEAVMFYFFVYLFMNLGAFWVVIVLQDRLGGSEMARFKGIAYTAPALFVAMFIFLISLTGLPPTAGFVGKVMLFKVVIGAGLGAMTPEGALTAGAIGYFILAVVGVLNSAVALFYYMKVAYPMAFEQPDEANPLVLAWADRAGAVALAVPTVGLIYFPPVLALVGLGT